MEITDRYKATGTPYPDENSCDECEGMGVYPQKKDTLNKEACKAPCGEITIIGQKGKDDKPIKDDNWVFIRCPYCKGGRKNN